MCGISCVLALEGRSRHPSHHDHAQTNGDTTASERKHLLQSLDASLDQIKHRGPDARGHWLSADNRVGTLVHHRSSLPSGITDDFPSQHSAT